MRWRQAVIIGVFGLGVGAVPLVALSQRGQSQGRLPPIGDRKYLLDGGDPAAPVDIKAAGAPTKTARFLKDPMQPSKHAKVEHPAPPRPVKPRRAVATAAQLRFRKMDVSGHLTRPRVEFSRDQLPMERADEPVGQDFFPKVFQPARDDGF